MEEERFLGRRFHQVRLPNSDRIILLFRWDQNDPNLSLYDLNHNIFRLDRDGNVVWQVVRDERNKHNMEAFYELAQTTGDGSYAYWGFTELWMEDESEKRFRCDVLKPGQKLIALANRGLNYEIDIETGVAVNITEMPHRL